jgi:DNA polymerase-3 subunit epsilon
MVAGQTIDTAAVANFIGPAVIIVAHNAAFDRPLAERLTKPSSSKPGPAR